VSDSDKPKLVVFPSDTGGPSPHGLSYWNQFQSGCPHARQLDIQYAEILKAQQVTSEDDDAQAVDIGAAFHKILEHYYGGTLDNVAFNTDLPSVVEALRLFAGYRERFPPTEFGRVVGCEVDFLFSESDSYSPFGIKPFSGRIDMVVEPDEIACARLGDFNKRNLALPGPGVYLLDTKTMGAKRKNLDWEYNNSMQFHAYMMAWNTLHSDTPCRGFIVNGVVRHKQLKDASFFSKFIPPPTPEQQQAVRAHLQFAQILRNAHGDDFKNRTQCFSWGRICPHFTSGACKRD